MSKLFKILLILFTAIVLVMACILLRKFTQYKKEETVTERIHSIAKPEQSNSLPRATSSINYTLDNEQSHAVAIAPEDVINIPALKDSNPDTVAYLRIPETPIEYPVVSSKDADKYAYMDFFGNLSSSGTIYMDKAIDLNSPNILIYGHRMKSGKMFGTIPRYEDLDYKDEHPKIHLITDSNVRIYTICATFKISPNDTAINNALRMDSQEDISLLNDHASAKGHLFSKIEEDAHYISLLTCEYSAANGRFIVIGKETERLRN